MRSVKEWCSVRIDEEDLAQIEKICKKRKMKRSEVLREAVKKYLTDKEWHINLEKLDELDTLRPELARVGGNLNQLARAFNMSGGLRDKDLIASHEELRGIFSRLIDVLTQAIEGHE